VYTFLGYSLSLPLSLCLSLYIYIYMRTVYTVYHIVKLHEISECGCHVITLTALFSSFLIPTGLISDRIERYWQDWCLNNGRLLRKSQKRLILLLFTGKIIWRVVNCFYNR